MNRRHIAVLSLLASSALGSCGDASDIIVPPLRDSTAPIQTDTTFYPLRRVGEGLATEIPLRYENQTGQRLYIVNCLGQLAPVLEKKVEETWEEFWSPNILLCLSPPIVIEPGGVLEDTVEVWGATPGQKLFPQFKSDDVEGTYRIVLHDVVFKYDDNQAGFGDPVPLEYRVSNLFVLYDPGRLYLITDIEEASGIGAPRYR